MEPEGELHLDHFKEGLEKNTSGEMELMQGLP
jgi:hypothetical protein